MSLPAIAIHRPVATSMVCVGVVLLGLVSYGSLPVDLLPDIGTPRITLMTRAVGLAPYEIETEVTRRIEGAVSGVQGQRRVTSVSREGMSVVTITFPWGVDLDMAALHVREAVDGVIDRLPETADRPTVLRWDPGSEPVMGVAVAKSLLAFSEGTMKLSWMAIKPRTTMISSLFSDSRTMKAS